MLLTSVARNAALFVASAKAERVADAVVPEPLFEADCTMAPEPSVP